MIRSMVVVWIVALGLGCSSVPERVEDDAGDTATVLDGSDVTSSAGQESGGVEGYGTVTQLEDERVSDPLIIVEDEGSNLAAATAKRQAERQAEIVIPKARPVFDDIYFDFDLQVPQKPMLARLRAQAEWLRTHTEAKVTVAGHCDTRGSREYNMVLGERRAQWIKTFFMKSGVSGDRISIISYGKEQPRCLDDTDRCHATNRRAHIVQQ